MVARNSAPLAHHLQQTIAVLTEPAVFCVRHEADARSCSSSFGGMKDTATASVCVPPPFPRYRFLVYCLRFTSTANLWTTPESSTSHFITVNTFACHCPTCHRSTLSLPPPPSTRTAATSSPAATRHSRCLKTCSRPTWTTNTADTQTYTSDQRLHATFPRWLAWPPRSSSMRGTSTILTRIAASRWQGSKRLTGSASC